MYGSVYKYLNEFNEEKHLMVLLSNAAERSCYNYDYDKIYRTGRIKRMLLQRRFGILHCDIYKLVSSSNSFDSICCWKKIS